MQTKNQKIILEIVCVVVLTHVFVYYSSKVLGEAYQNFISN